MRLRTLGQCVIEIGETRLGPDAEVLFALALYLAAEGGRRVSRGSLTGLLWPDSEDARGAHSLRQAVYRLRAFGAAIGSDRSHVWVDDARVEADFARVLQPSAAFEPDEVAALIGGPFLPGYAPAVSAPFAEWVDRQRDIVNAGVRRVLIAAIAARRAQGDWGAVAALAARCLGIDPLNEEATLASAEAAAVQGGKAHAVAILDRYLRDIGPGAREIRIPASLLRRRIAEAPQFERPAPRGDAPFVGRAAEMEELNRALQLAHCGQGSAHLIWGEPGIGKTRLVHEFGRGALFQHVQVIRGGCQSSDERRPLSAFVDLVPKLMALPGALGCAPESMRYLRRMVEHDGHDGEPTPDTREAALLNASIRRSLFDVLDAIASEACLVLIVEDVHWLDAMSWEVVAEAAPWVPSRRLLLVLTSRAPNPERQRGLAELGGLHRRQLGPLPDAASRALVEALVGGSGRAPRADLAAWCLANGGGNPYYLCELARRGLQATGAYEVPASLTVLIAERLTRLHPISLRVLQACAVLGKHSTLERLEALLEQRRVDLLDSLDELEANGLVASDGAKTSSRHELLSRAALSRLSAPSRRLLHRHVALLLERSVEEPQSAAMLWACADHWQCAGEVGRALRFVRSCARHAIEMGLPGEAASLLERASALSATSSERADLLRDQAAALRLAGQWERVLEVLQHERTLRRRGMKRDIGDVVHDDVEVVEFEARWRCGGNSSELFEQLYRCAACPTAPPEHRVKAATLAFMLADNLFCSDRARELFAAMSACLASNLINEITRHHLQLIYHAAFGDLDVASDEAQLIIRLARAVSDPAQLAKTLYHAAMAFRSAGFVTESISAAIDATELADRYSLSSLSSSAAHFLAATHRNLGHLTDANSWYSRAVRYLSLIQDQGAVATTYSTGAILALTSADCGEAKRLLDLSTAAWGRIEHSRRHLVFEAISMGITLFGACEPADPTAVTVLAERYDVARNHVALDFVVAVLCHALLSTGDSARATTVLRDFLVLHRRDRCPLSPELQLLAKTFTPELSSK